MDVPTGTLGIVGFIFLLSSLKTFLLHKYWLSSSSVLAPWETQGSCTYRTYSLAGIFPEHKVAWWEVGETVFFELCTPDAANTILWDFELFESQWFLLSWSPQTTQMSVMLLNVCWWKGHWKNLNIFALHIPNFRKYSFFSDVFCIIFNLFESSLSLLAFIKQNSL